MFFFSPLRDSGATHHHPTPELFFLVVSAGCLWYGASFYGYDASQLHLFGMGWGFSDGILIGDAEDLSLTLVVDSVGPATCSNMLISGVQVYRHLNQIFQASKR